MKINTKTLIIALFAIVLLIGTYLYINKDSTCIETYPNGECLPEGMCVTATDGIASCDYVDVIREAEEFEKNNPGTCLTVLTPATHNETGAKFTFSSSCIPDGWVSDL